ncbi:hypothetical protein HHI36_015921 [Cryptolaemus montrouzieri]|uniref:Coiled-coil domain-containing protein 137 n=1 Tax=Cryptolaemus montrouzieri TaxID=559131 RepID=A0ABD2N7G1_9CUCU
MGRKIPGRKHRGVRDPEQQRAQRLLKNKFDAPPQNIEEQPVPKSVLRIAQLIKKTKHPLKVTKNKEKPLKKKKLVVVNTKVGINEKPVPKFEQKKGESDNAFLYRVNRICDEVKREAAFEKKFGVDVKRNPETGKVEGIVKRKKDPLEIILKETKKEKKEKKLAKKKKGENDTEQGPRLTKSQKRQLKLKEKKKKKKMGKMDEFHTFSDNVKFGEIVHAPPTLTAPRLVAKENTAPRPGKRHLLLNSLINKNEENSKPAIHVGKSAASIKGVSNKVIDKKGKRKDLPKALRRQLDMQQKEIIEAYKSIKAKKHKKN